jgi:hypothetical protein
MNAKGGLAKGKSHAEGGIKAKVKSTGQRIEFEGGEVIVNKTNVADPTKYEFEGEQKTTCEILSDLNSKNNNGVTLDCDSVEGKKYKYAKGGSVSDEIDYEGWQKQQRIDLFAKNGVKIPTIIYHDNSLGLYRHEMPQVRSHYLDDFLDTLKEDNISYGYSIIEAKNLKPTQKEINMDRVNMITEDLVNSKHLIVSSDDYVLDGHHRWKWAEMNDKEIKALRIDLPIRELLHYLRSFPLTEYADIKTRKMEFGGSVEDKVKLWMDARKELVPKQQVAYLMELEEDGGADPIEVRDMLINVVNAYQEIPKLYKQDGKGKNAVCYLHYFVGGTDWYITEWDRANEFYGFVVLNGDWQMAEFGYIPKEYLIDNDLSPLNKPQLDFYWKYKTINEILEKEYPQGVQPPIKRYEAEKGMVVPTLMKTDWQKLIEENSFKNPFEKAEAIENMLDEKGEDPNNYSVIEKKFISEYTGIGGMEKYGAKRRDVGEGVDFDYGLLYEFFTPAKLCQIMWGLAYKHSGNLSIKNVLEPSMGAGAFISQAPLNVNIDGYDINKYCYMINKILYTEDRFNFYHDSFEKLFINNYKSVKDNVTPMYDLVIGNPPYGEYKGKYAVMGGSKSEKKHTKADDFIDYFIQRGLDLLVPNGLLVFVIGSVNALGGVPFLEKKMTPSKSRILAKSDLVDAYRLGNSMFEFTSVDADIIVLRKK